MQQLCVCVGGGGGAWGGGGSVFYRCEEYAWLLHEIDYVRISLTREKYWYEIRDVLVPILHALWGMGYQFFKREIYEVWNLRFHTAPIKQLYYL